MKKRTAFWLVALMAVAVRLPAQLPTSNIYLFDLQPAADGDYELHNPRYLTWFNPSGYNNQPYFFSDTELYITCQSPDDLQPDLFMLNLADTTRLRITDTPEGEFSPMPMLDYRSFSAVRQEVIGRDTVLRLWQFPLDRSSEGRPVFRSLQGMGYYHWVSNRQVALFLVGAPNTLALADVYNDQVRTLATNVGRCFVKLPNGNLAYVQKEANGVGFLMELDLFRPSAAPTRLVAMPDGAEDFVVLPDGAFLLGRASKLYRYNRYADEDWVEVADLRHYRLRNISRLAVSGGFKLALVAD